MKSRKYISNAGFLVSVICVVIISIELLANMSFTDGLGSVILGLVLFIPLNVGAHLIIALLSWSRRAKWKLAEIILPVNAVVLMILRSRWMSEEGGDAQSAIAEYLIIPIYVLAYSVPLILLFLLLSSPRRVE